MWPELGTFLECAVVAAVEIMWADEIVEVMIWLADPYTSLLSCRPIPALFPGY